MEFYINILYKTLQFHLPPIFISDIALYRYCSMISVKSTFPAFLFFCHINVITFVCG